MTIGILPRSLWVVLEIFVISGVFGWVSILTQREDRTHCWLTDIYVSQKEDRWSQKTHVHVHGGLLYAKQTLWLFILWSLERSLGLTDLIHLSHLGVLTHKAKYMG